MVAPLAIARKLGMPRRILVVLEGEGLANDATALILYRFAVAAISTGVFSLPKATGTFVVIVVGEVLFGAAVGWLSLRMRHRARDPQVEITLSLITPYIAYWIPEHFGGSGVIATVACGLYMSWNGPLLISSATRLQGIFFWDLVIYLIEGLAVPADRASRCGLLFEKSKAFPLDDILFATALVAVIVIVARFAWVYPATYLPRLINQAPARARSDAVMAHRVRGRLHRRARRGVAGRGAGAAVRAAERRGLSLSRPDPVRLLRRHLHHAGGTWAGPAAGGALARRRAGRPRRSTSPSTNPEIAARREALDAALKSLDAITDDRELSDEVVKLLRARHEIRANQLPDLARSRPARCLGDRHAT